MIQSQLILSLFEVDVMDTDLGTMLRGFRSGFKVRTVRPAAGKSERSLNLDHEATEHSFSAPAPKAKMPYNLENLNLVIKLVILKRCIYSVGVVIIYCRAACFDLERILDHCQRHSEHLSCSHAWSLNFAACTLSRAVVLSTSKTQSYSSGYRSSLQSLRFIPALDRERE